jgi:hypothetical protein
MPINSRPTFDHKEWGPFLKDVDQQLQEQVVLHCLGGFVLRVLYDIPRHTGDIDYLEALPSVAKDSLARIAGPDSGLAKKHKVFIHFAGVIDMPENYEERLIDITGDLKNLKLFVPEVYDLLLSKLTRNSPKDIEDVQYVINREKLSFAQLRERFEEMRPVTGDRRTHELTLELWKDFFPDGAP